MIDNFTSLWEVLLQTSMLFLLFFIVYRKYIISVFDPLLFFLIIQAFSVQLGILTLNNNAYLWQIIICECTLTIGFILTAPTTKMFKLNEDKTSWITSKKLFLILKVFCNVSLIFIILLNLILITQKGIALFSADPSEAKVTSFSSGGGMGIIKRVNWGLVYLVGSIYMYIFLITSKKKYLFCLFILIIVLSLSGSKGAILYFIQVIAFFGLNSIIRSSRNFRTLRKLGVFLIPATVFLALYILFAVNKNAQIAVLELGTRFLFFGDAILAYYNKYTVRHFSQYGIIAFLNSEFNSELGLFRLVNYSLPFGYQLEMYNANVSEVPVFGPNIPFYVKGYIFFGYYGSFLYAFCIGLFIGKMRHWLLACLRKPFNDVKILLIIFINTQIFSVAQDSALFLSVVFDTFIFAALMLTITCLILYPKLYGGVFNNREIDETKLIREI